MPEGSARTTVGRLGSLGASVLCLTCGVRIGVITMQFVIEGEQNANPLAILALVYLLPAVAYCLAGYLVLTQRRVGGWLAVLTAAAWSLPLWAYDGEPGWPWTESTQFFLVANLGIILLVVLSWRRLRPSPRQVGA